MIPLRNPGLLYKLGISAVAITMLVLPLLYVGLTMLACWGVYYFATHYFLQIWDWHMGNSRYAVGLKLMFSITPLLVGTVVALFMIKPLFARRAARMHPLTLDPSAEHRVYQMVQEVCGLLEAPPPKFIAMNCEVNASAGFDRGWKGMFGNSLVLTIGLPLVAGLSQRELAGVIAHEFGHFRQGAGMRVSYVIRSINHWFSRVIYERDAWDETIESWSQSEEWGVSFMVGCARFGVWVSRSILWVLMTIGHAMSSFLLRQMEYDADEAEILLAGSVAFESTSLKLATLGAVYSDIHLEMRRSWRGKFCLPDNLPLLVQHKLGLVSESRKKHLENEICLAATGWLDTHPATADRVRAARLLAQPGYEISDEPASELFNYFENVSRMVTLAYYEDDLNVPTSDDFLYSVNKVIGAESLTTPSATDAEVENSTQ